MEKSLRHRARRAVLQQIAPQYRQASAAQKRTLLDTFVGTTGYHRTYARWLLNPAEEVEQMPRDGADKTDPGLAAYPQRSR